MTISTHIKRQLGQGALPQNWLFLGVGYTAKALIAALPRGLDMTGTSRDASRWPAALRARVTGISFHGEINPSLLRAMSKAEALVISLPPSRAGDPFLSALSADIKSRLPELMPKLRWAAYLSATSVYGDRGGQWAFEDEYLNPSMQRGLNRADAELAWLETGLPIHVFRLAGIYGSSYFGQSRNPFARLKSGKARAVIKPDHVVNRIHAEDISTALMASCAAPNPLRIYNLADGHPAPPQIVLDYAARLCGAEPPPRVGVDSEQISDMARSFYSETKRVSNRRAREELGWAPRFASYESGLLAAYKSMGKTS